ncbi:MAG: hypothetical protein HC804_15235, partial [Anaerolineae bacterium]|nr:hypothetical protein [Anaerolineae bacterium]
VAMGDLDAIYLTGLSDDALPQLIQTIYLTEGDGAEQLMPSCADPFSRVQRTDCYAVPYDIVQDELHGRLQSMSGNSDWKQWQSFHLARWQAFARLHLWAKTSDIGG